jgi:hypothetical protein
MNVHEGLYICSEVQGVQKVTQPYGKSIYFTVSAGSDRSSVFHTSGHG